LFLYSTGFIIIIGWVISSLSEHPDEVTLIHDTATYFNGNTVSPTDYGKTYTVQSPIFQHHTSVVDQIGINTSLLSLRNDEDGKGRLLFLSSLCQTEEC